MMTYINISLITIIILCSNDTVNLTNLILMHYYFHVFFSKPLFYALLLNYHVIFLDLSLQYNDIYLYLPYCYYICCNNIVNLINLLLMLYINHYYNYILTYLTL